MRIAKVAAVAYLIKRQDAKIIDIYEDTEYIQYSDGLVRGVCTDPNCTCVGSWGDEWEGID